MSWRALTVYCSGVGEGGGGAVEGPVLTGALIRGRVPCRFILTIANHCGLHGKALLLLNTTTCDSSGSNITSRHQIIKTVCLQC